MKFILLLFMSFSTYADTYWSSCAAMNAQMASENVSDNTGSISQAYSCETGEITVIAQINAQISVNAIEAASESFINHYCLNLSKNYLLTNETDQKLIDFMYRGGVKYVITHPRMSKIVLKKSLEQCLEYVQIMETQLPENPYEQIKFIRKFTP